MSLKQQEDLGIPDETRRVAMAAFPKSCACLRIGHVWGCFLLKPASNITAVAINILRIAFWANGTPVAQPRCSHFAALQFHAA